MKTIQLTNGGVASVDNQDFDKLNLRKWWRIDGKSNSYVVSIEAGKWVKMHTEVLGKPKFGLVVDHINRDEHSSLANTNT